LHSLQRHPAQCICPYCANLSGSIHGAGCVSRGGRGRFQAPESDDRKCCHSFAGNEERQCRRAEDSAAILLRAARRRSRASSQLQAARHASLAMTMDRHDWPCGVEGNREDQAVPTEHDQIPMQLCAPRHETTDEPSWPQWAVPDRRHGDSKQADRIAGDLVERTRGREGLNPWDHARDDESHEADAPRQGEGVHEEDADRRRHAAIASSARGASDPRTSFAQE